MNPVSQVFGDIEAFVQQHPGTTIQSCDNVLMWCLGWSLTSPTGDERLFELKLVDYKVAAAGLHPHLRELLKSPSGRAELAQRLEQGCHLRLDKESSELDLFEPPSSGVPGATQ